MIMRPGELFALDWEHIDLDAELVHVERRGQGGEYDLPKSNRVRTIALFPQAREAVEALPERDGPVFRSKRGVRLRARRGQVLDGPAQRPAHFDFYLATKHYAMVHHIRGKLGLPNHDIAEQAGWSEAAVEDMVKTYAHTTVWAACSTGIKAAAGDKRDADRDADPTDPAPRADLIQSELAGLQAFRHRSASATRSSREVLRFEDLRPPPPADLCSVPVGASPRVTGQWLRCNRLRRPCVSQTGRTGRSREGGRHATHAAHHHRRPRGRAAPCRPRTAAADPGTCGPPTRATRRLWQPQSATRIRARRTRDAARPRRRASTPTCALRRAKAGRRPPPT